MTIVPKKKTEPRPANKQGQAVVGPENAVKSKQDEEGHQQDGNQQQQQQQQLQLQQQHAEPHQALGQPAANQMLAGTDTAQEDNTDYTGYNNNNSAGDGDEQTHDRRQYHPHQHHQQQQTHHHHNQHHPHSKYANSRTSDNESNVNHVILITVINPHYPITVELIHQICSTYGKVNRIVIFKKNGVQAMVEFDNIDAAKRARSSLHGCDIYSGCCTLKVEYAKTPKLNVHKNDSESFDYTNPNLGSGPNHASPSESGPSETGNQAQQHHHHHQHHMHTSNHSSQHGHGHGPSASHHHHRDSGMSKRGVAGSTGAIVGGGDVMNVAGQSNSGPHSQHHHHHHASQFHPAHPQNMQPASQQHHPKQHPISSAIEGAGGGQHHGGLQSTGYMVGGQPLDQTGQSNNTDATASGTFHPQDGGFNLAPRGNIGNPAGAANVTGPHQASFVSGGGDTFMPPSATGSGHHPHMNPHGMHGGTLYPRQETSHHHHQHHPQHSQSHYQSHHLNTRGVGGPVGGSGGGGHRGHNPSFPPSISATNPLIAGGGPHLAPQGTVMMVYGLGIDRVNCDRLFNLFCLYGNVVRVKFLRSKEGCAMVQMGDVIAVDRCVSSLNKITLFGNEMQISYSKQPFLHDVIQPFTLPDGTPSFKDFMVNKNNRFRNPEVASKNKILPPSRILHFFNAPYGISDEELILIFKQTAGHEPAALKIFTPKVENAKSFSGLVTFRDPTEATEALVLCNHLSLPKAGAQHPYILRLCFSSPAY